MPEDKCIAGLICKLLEIPTKLVDQHDYELAANELLDVVYPIIRTAVLQEAADALRLKRLTQTSHCNLSSAHCIGSGACRGCDPEPSPERLAELAASVPGIGDYLGAEAWLKERAANG